MPERRSKPCRRKASVRREAPAAKPPARERGVARVGVSRRGRLRVRPEAGAAAGGRPRGSDDPGGCAKGWRGLDAPGAIGTRNADETREVVGSSRECEWCGQRERRISVNGPDRRRSGRFVQSGRTTFFPVPVLLTSTTGRTDTFFQVPELNEPARRSARPAAVRPVSRAGGRRARAVRTGRRGIDGRKPEIGVRDRSCRG